MSNPAFSWNSLFGCSDEQLMWRVKTEDDAEAFARVMRRWEKPIQRLCMRMTGDRQQGEDLAQETFARLYGRRQTYEPSGRFSTFLWRIALNLCHDELRRSKRRPEFSFTEISETDDYLCLHEESLSPDSALAERERVEAVRQAVLQLAESYRVVVVLRHYESLKFVQIGEVLGIPEGTVKSRMAEALGQLHRLLSADKSARSPGHTSTFESLIL